MRIDHIWPFRPLLKIFCILIAGGLVLLGYIFLEHFPTLDILKTFGIQIVFKNVFPKICVPFITDTVHLRCSPYSLLLFCLFYPRLERRADNRKTPQRKMVACSGSTPTQDKSMSAI